MYAARVKTLCPNNTNEERNSFQEVPGDLPRIAVFQNLSMKQIYADSLQSREVTTILVICLKGSVFPLDESLFRQLLKHKSVLFTHTSLEFINL